MDQKMIRYDHNGKRLVIPHGVSTCFDTTGAWRTHRLFGVNNIRQEFQHLTLCGRRGGAFPGNSEVDCPECVAAMEEWAQSQAKAAVTPTETEAP